MPINPSQFSAQPIEDNRDVGIEILLTRPTAGAYFEPADIPNRLVGYYDPFTDMVELYVVDNSGHRYLKIS